MNPCQRLITIPENLIEWTNLLVHQTGNKICGDPKHQHWHQKVVNFHLWVSQMQCPRVYFQEQVHQKNCGEPSHCKFCSGPAELMPRTLYVRPVYSKSSFDHQARETCGSEEANLVEKKIYFSYEVALSSQVFQGVVDGTFTTIKDDLTCYVTDNHGKKVPSRQMC